MTYVRVASDRRFLLSIGKQFVTKMAAEDWSRWPREAVEPPTWIFNSILDVVLDNWF